MDAAKRKELVNAYQNRPIIGGVCCIRCSGNQRVLLRATNNLESAKNRFEFAMKIQSCPEPALREEWKTYGMASFSFAVLEELQKGKDQTDKEFDADLAVLYEMWSEKLQKGEL